MKFFYGFTILFVLGLATVAQAQVLSYHASTAGESYARGAGDMMRSAGDRNLSNSQAAINMQDAYSKGIDNSIKATNAYWERREIYNQHREKKLYEISEHRKRVIARNRLQPLTPSEFDRSTGAITWPKVLTQPQYDQYRDTLDELFLKQAKNGYLTSDDYLAAQTASKGWRQMLTKQRDVYPAPILDQMTRFILKINRQLNNNLS